MPHGSKGGAPWKQPPIERRPLWSLLWLSVRFSLRDMLAPTGLAVRHIPTAKKEKGFSKAYDNYWDTLAAAILGHGVQVLAGDFNMLPADTAVSAYLAT